MRSQLGIVDPNEEEWPVDAWPFDAPVDLPAAAQCALTTRHPQLGLAAVAALRRITESLETLHVAKARKLGLSWQEIADSLGVSKQTAHRKYKNKDLAGLERGIGRSVEDR